LQFLRCSLTSLVLI